MKYLLLITILLSACTYNIEVNKPSRDECVDVEKGSAKYYLLVCEEE